MMNGLTSKVDLDEVGIRMSAEAKEHQRWQQFRREELVRREKGLVKLGVPLTELEEKYGIKFGDLVLAIYRYDLVVRDIRPLMPRYVTGVYSNLTHKNPALNKITGILNFLIEADQHPDLDLQTKPDAGAYCFRIYPYGRIKKGPRIENDSIDGVAYQELATHEVLNMYRLITRKELTDLVKNTFLTPPI